MRKLSDTPGKIRGLSAAAAAAFAAVLFVLIFFFAGESAQEVSEEVEPELTVTSLYDIPQDEIEEIRAAAEDIITDRVVEVHMSGVEITGLSYDGWCLVEAIDEDSDSGNTLCIIYTVDMDADVPEYGVTDQFSFFTYVEFDDVEIGSDGTLGVNPEQAAITHTELKYPFDTTSSSTPVIYGYYDGYGTMDELITHIEETGTIIDSYEE